MRLHTTLLLAAAFVGSGYASPQTSAPQKGAPQIEHREAERKPNECAGETKVRPGENATNNDGVTVTNDAGSAGDAYVDPKAGCGNGASVSKVRTKVGFEGTVEGLDANDSVTLSSSNTATVKGDGGSVTISGGSTVTVEVEPGGAPISVTLPSGTTTTVNSGSSTFNT